jgi:hypothetical protein
MGESEFLTAEQAGQLLHMRADSVTRKIRRREIPAVDEEQTSQPGVPPWLAGPPERFRYIASSAEA